MYVCVCKAVTENDVHRAISRGASSLRDLRQGLGVASECGRCAGCARQCLREARQSANPISMLSLTPSASLALPEAV